MPGRTPKEAADKFVEFLRESLNCLSSDFVNAYQQSAKLYKVFYEPYAQVRNRKDLIFHVSIAQIFRCMADPNTPKQFKAKTQEYSYTLLNSESQELVSYHWHPNDPGVTQPHLHLHAEGIKRIHFPTSRVCIEDFILLLIRDYEIIPNLSHTECRRLLTKNKENFEKYATWKVKQP